jgi:hypothetical protein
VTSTHDEAKIERDHRISKDQSAQQIPESNTTKSVQPSISNTLWKSILGNEIESTISMNRIKGLTTTTKINNAKFQTNLWANDNRSKR